MKYRAIKDHASRFDICLMCRVLQVSRAGYYAWRKRAPSAHWLKDQRLLVQIRASHAASHGNYGSPRVVHDVRAAGERCSVNRVARLMQANSIRARRKRHWRTTTLSHHDLVVAQNTLNRQFNPSGPNQVWVSDITYVRTRQNWLYLTVILDLYSRAVVGWSMSTDMTTPSVMGALQMAIQQRRPGKGLMHHSDRGVQYASQEYQQLLREHHIQCSMSRKGNCWDNACAESFFSTLKRECIHDQVYSNPQEARRDLFHWIEVVYNRRRRHSTLDYRSPFEFERRPVAA